MKRAAAEAALDFIDLGDIVGVGTGSTANHFIEWLAKAKGKIDGAVASSQETEKRLKAAGIAVLDLNRTGTLPLYVDGADEANKHRHLIKGGGGALTREKILAAASEKFVCIVDSTKMTDVLGSFPLPIEVIPMARSYVSRQMIGLGGAPGCRPAFTTDNGHEIIDVQNLDLTDPPAIERRINCLAGVVSNGIFALRPADAILVGRENEVSRI